jgi:flagellar biosynthesis anti-sigma factor FlgM
MVGPNRRFVLKDKMKKLKKKGPKTVARPGKYKGSSKQRLGCCWPFRPGAPDLGKDDRLIEQVRQIIAETPEVRPEKVARLEEAVASGAYEIDARKLANRLITKIILES